MHIPPPQAHRSGFSALQRAENSSIPTSIPTRRMRIWFQCSSASRKFLNLTQHARRRSQPKCFSALQRAENSSMLRTSTRRWRRSSFSALQRAENSSIYPARPEPRFLFRFQCSSASRKFLNGVKERQRPTFETVSVLFSEPKIPQSPVAVAAAARRTRFSALQRAENSSIGASEEDAAKDEKFQCSSASRKFLNSRASASAGTD